MPVSTPMLIESPPVVATRAANATPYTAGDAITDAGGAAFTLAGSSYNDTGVLLQSMNLSTNDTGLATNITVEAWIYNTAVTPAADNAAFSAPAAGLVGIMSGTFRATSDGGAAILTPVAGPFVPCKPMPGTNTFKVILKAISAFTPSGNSTTVTIASKGIVCA